MNGAISDSSIASHATNPARPSNDRANTSPTTVSEIIDACAPVMETYEQLWSAAHVERVERQKMIPLCDTGATLRSTHFCQNGS